MKQHTAAHDFVSLLHIETGNKTRKISKPDPETGLRHLGEKNFLRLPGKLNV